MWASGSRFPAMRIAVISDTHDRFPVTLPGRLKEADEIWHLGDVCEPATLAEFQNLGRPLHVVLGNCDWDAVWPLELELEREGFRFFLTHIPPLEAPTGFAGVLHGHTHVPRDDLSAGARWLNPGCITRPRGMPPSFAWLNLENGKAWQWKVVPL
jgi:putative phosphoesterase